MYEGVEKEKQTQNVDGKKKSSQIYMELQAQTSIYTQFQCFFCFVLYDRTYIFQCEIFFGVCAFTSFFDFSYISFLVLLFASLVSPNCVKVTQGEEDKQLKKPAKQY